MANSIQNLLMQAQTAIDNALTDDEVKGFLSVFGYDDTVLNAGKALLDEANQLNQQQLKEYGDQYSATQEFTAKWETAKSDYTRFIKIARVAVKKDPAAYQKLGLSGPRRQSFSSLSAQMDKFYTNALADPAILSALGRFGVTQDKLTSGKQNYDAAKAASVTQQNEKGEAQQATLARDKAVDALEDWLSDFTAIARIALEEKPQLLEKLGILERS